MDNRFKKLIKDLEKNNREVSYFIALIDGYFHLITIRNYRIHLIDVLLELDGIIGRANRSYYKTIFSKKLSTQKKKEKINKIKNRFIKDFLSSEIFREYSLTNLENLKNFIEKIKQLSIYLDTSNIKFITTNITNSMDKSAYVLDFEFKKPEILIYNIGSKHFSPETYFIDLNITSFVEKWIKEIEKNKNI